MDIEIEYNSKTKIISRKDDIVINESGLGSRLFQCMKLNQDSIAQIYAPTGEVETNSTLLIKCIRTAIEMKRIGLKAGDIISICSYNQLNSVVPFVAAQFIGVIVSTIDPSIELKDIKHLLNISKPIMIFISDNCEEWIESVIDVKNTKIITFGDCTKFDNFNEFLKPKKDETTFEPIIMENGNETAVILFSSGTTGLPKGICLSHNFLILNSRYMYNVFLDTFKVALNYASLYWISVIVMIVHHIENNCTRILCNKYNPELFWTYVEKYNIELVMVPPAIAIRNHLIKPKNWLPKTLKYLYIGGSSISLTYFENIRKSLPQTNVITGYGLTEMGLCTIQYPTNPIYHNKMCTVGSPMPGFQFKVVDLENDNPLGFNKIGEFRIKSCYGLNGYHNQDSSDCYDSEGFLKTGDLFYYDEDFCFYMTDRIKEMFKYLSWHIIPAKLEAILEKHKDVELSAVIGLPHSEDEHHAAGVVVLHKGATATKEDLQMFVDDQVDDRNKLRGGIIIVKSLPYTPTGKIVRRQIRDMVLDGTINKL